MVLQSIRDRLTGILAFAILGIIAVPFALVGVNQYFTSGSENLVAQVNDTEITTNDFNQSYSNYRRRMQSIMGAAYDPAEFDSLVQRRQHLDTLVDEELITQAAQSMGLDVDDETLAEEIRKIPAFQVDGVFNADVYQSRLQSQGMTPMRFQNEMRASFVLNQLPRNVTASSIATPAEVEEFVALLEQGRTFNATLVPAQVDALDVEISDEQVDEWYQANTADYQSEEQVVIEFVELDAAMMETGEPPSEDLLREQYEAQKNRFITPEQRQVSHILIEVAPDAAEAEVETARQTAEALAERARAGEDFPALASEHSDDQGSAPQGGDLGWVEPGVMVEAFEVGMYELSLDNPISDPVQTGFGWHVIQLRDIRESTGMSYEEASITLVQEYHEEQAARVFLEQADRLVDLVYEDPTTLEHAGMMLELPVYTEGPFSRAGGEGIAAYPGVVEAAFSDLVLLQGSVSDPVNLDENHLVMVRLSEHLPVMTRPLEEVREEIVATLRENLAREQANARAEALLADLQGGETDLEALATEAELEFGQHEAVQRAAQVPDATLVAEVFRLQAPAEGVTTQAVLPTTQGYAVVELLNVEPGEIAEDAAPFVRQQYERVVANGYASQEAFALIRQLRAAAEVEIFEERIAN